MKVAALDLGTNTFLCLIAEVSKNQVTKIFEDQVQVVRLGQGVAESKKFHPEALVRARKTLTDFSKLIQAYRPDKVLAMATSAARDVTNGEELFAVCRDLQIPVQIIPGEKEASLTYAGAVSNLWGEKKRLVIDVGGGSTELIVGQGSVMKDGLSLDLGCVRLTEGLPLRIPASPESVAKARLEIAGQMTVAMKGLLEKIGSVDEVIAVAGTPTELAKIEVGAFIPEKIDGYFLTLQKLEIWAQEFSLLRPEDLVAKYKVHPGRADVLLAGVLILSEALRQVGKSEMSVSTRGVRYGIALDLAKKTT